MVRMTSCGGPIQTSLDSMTLLAKRASSFSRSAMSLWSAVRSSILSMARSIPAATKPLSVLNAEKIARRSVYGA